MHISNVPSAGIKAENATNKSYPRKIKHLVVPSRFGYNVRS